MFWSSALPSSTQESLSGQMCFFCLCLSRFLSRSFFLNLSPTVTRTYFRVKTIQQTNFLEASFITNKAYIIIFISHSHSGIYSSVIKVRDNMCIDRAPSLILGMLPEKNRFQISFSFLSLSLFLSLQLTQFYQASQRSPKGSEEQQAGKETVIVTKVLDIDSRTPFPSLTSLSLRVQFDLL